MEFRTNITSGADARAEAFTSGNASMDTSGSSISPTCKSCDASSPSSAPAGSASAVSAAAAASSAAATSSAASADSADSADSDSVAASVAPTGSGSAAAAASSAAATSSADSADSGSVAASPAATPSTAPASSDSAPRILIIYTGGTIGMTEDLATGALVPFSFEHLIKNVPKLGRLGYRLDHQELNPPIDSSNMNPAVWREIAQMIVSGYDDFDGFVILHGTDTMAYTASALSFMLPGLTKPVILTGSQLPIGEIREDGTENLITALQIAGARTEAGAPRVQEVAISFGRFLWRGNRSTKMSSTNFGAFRSFNYPPLAAMDLHITYDTDRLLHPAPGTRLAPALAMDPAVAVAFLYPGITEAQLRPQLTAPGTKGVVLRTFGAGNAPTEKWFTELMAEVVASGTVIVNVTQCPAGGVEEKRYATGDALALAGVTSGYDITCEAAVTKLMHLFGQGLTGAEAAAAMVKPLAGEMTVEW